MAPRVSVFLFVKNRAQTIRRSVESVLAQTFQDFEYVIQDGASTDGTLEILREYAGRDPRIRLQSEPDAGAADGFWRALRRCRAEYVAACLSDEELLPHALAEGVAILDGHPGAAAVTRDAYLTDRDGLILRTIEGQPFDLSAYLANRFAPNFAAAMFRRASLVGAGLHTRDWNPDCGEFELWCRAAGQGAVLYVPGVVAKYGFHDGQLSREPANATRIARGRLAVLDRMEREGSCDPHTAAAARAATAASFGRHLLSVGAADSALDLLLDPVVAADALGTAPASGLPGEYARFARGQRLATEDARSMQILEVATALTDVDADVYIEIARGYAVQQRIDDALAMYGEALRLDPASRDANWEHGVLLERRGQIDEALEAWRRSGMTTDAYRHSTYLVAALKSPSSTNQSLLDEHLAWARLHADPACAIGAPPLPTWKPGERITVGYACSFWAADTITFQLLPMLRRHDRNRFRVVAYVHEPPGPLVRDAVDEVRLVSGLSNAAYLEQVRRDGVHILVEVNGHSHGHWFAAMAGRCAPVQISYLNYTSTCGVEQVDYILGDAIAVPDGTDRFFVEKVHRLPGCFFCFTYDGADLPPVAPPPSASTGHVTFGCFGSSGKINPALIALWAAVLQRVPESRLFIRNNELTPADNRRALAAAFAAHGIGSERLRLLAGTHRRGVLDSYAEVDISLDTFPYCGGNTIAESLWQGVPVITLRGERFSSAYGASLLTASGLPELVARTPAEYVDIAAALAADSARLRAYRDSLRDAVRAHGFADADRFTATLDAAYEELLRRRMTS